MHMHIRMYAQGFIRGASDGCMREEPKEACAEPKCSERQSGTRRGAQARQQAKGPHMPKVVHAYVYALIVGRKLDSRYRSVPTPAAMLKAPRSVA